MLWSEGEHERKTEGCGVAPYSKKTRLRFFSWTERHAAQSGGVFTSCAFVQSNGRVPETVLPQKSESKPTDPQGRVQGDSRMATKNCKYLSVF